MFFTEMEPFVVSRDCERSRGVKCIPSIYRTISGSRMHIVESCRLECWFHWIFYINSVIHGKFCNEFLAMNATRSCKWSVGILMARQIPSQIAAQFINFHTKYSPTIIRRGNKCRTFNNFINNRRYVMDIVGYLTFKSLLASNCCMNGQSAHQIKIKKKSF